MVLSKRKEIEGGDDSYLMPSAIGALVIYFNILYFKFLSSPDTDMRMMLIHGYADVTNLQIHKFAYS